MNKVKVGDKVICNANSLCDLTKGKTYEVIEVCDEDGVITVYDDVGDEHELLSSSFTLVEDSEPLLVHLTQKKKRFT